MRTLIFFFSFFTSCLALEFQIYLITIIKTFSTIPIIQKAVRAVAKEFLKRILKGYYSISLRSLYLWCDMSTNLIFKTTYLAVLP